MVLHADSSELIAGVEAWQFPVTKGCQHRPNALKYVLYGSKMAPLTFKNLHMVRREKLGELLTCMAQVRPRTWHASRLRFQAVIFVPRAQKQTF